MSRTVDLVLWTFPQASNSSVVRGAWPLSSWAEWVPRPLLLISHVSKYFPVPQHTRHYCHAIRDHGWYVSRYPVCSLPSLIEGLRRQLSPNLPILGLLVNPQLHLLPSSPSSLLLSDSLLICNCPRSRLSPADPLACCDTLFSRDRDKREGEKDWCLSETEKQSMDAQTA